MADILIVEDEGVVSMNAEMFLSTEGHNVLDIVNNGRDALKILETSKPNLILMDIILHGDISGTETTKLINEKFSDIPVAYMTAHTDAQTRERMAETKHIGILFKPFDISQLMELIEKASQTE
jgi:DNA-binding NtrC family response regulator